MRVARAEIFHKLIILNGLKVILTHRQRILITAIDHRPLDTIADRHAAEVKYLRKVLPAPEVVRIDERLDFIVLIAGIARRLQHRLPPVNRFVDDPVFDAGAVLDDGLQLEVKQHADRDDDADRQSDVENREDQAPSC